MRCIFSRESLGFACNSHDGSGNLFFGGNTDVQEPILDCIVQLTLNKILYPVKRMCEMFTTHSILNVNVGG